MNIFFLSENKMLQNMLREACDVRNCPNICDVEAISDIPALADNDTILLHVTGPEQQPIRQVKALNARHKHMRIVLLVREKLVAQMRADLSDQTHAIIPENSDIETLIGALVVVHHGYRVFPDPLDAHATLTPNGNVTGFRIDDIAGVTLAKTSKEAALSRRERTILVRLSQGGSNKDIAKDLGIEVSTVKVHLRACYRKIGARNRTQAAVWAAERLCD